MGQNKQGWSADELPSQPSWRLVFEEKFEASYQVDHCQRAVAAFRHSSFFIFMIYVMLSSGIYIFIPADDVSRWFALYGWVGLIIFGAGLLSHIHRLDSKFSLYAGLGSCAAVALSVAVTGVVVDSAAGQLTQVAIIYAIVIIYTVVGLTFFQATAAGWIGGALGLVLVWSINGTVNWDLLHRTYTGGSLLGMFIAYFAERRDRELFIQKAHLHDARSRAETYANKVDLLSRQDALTELANRRHFDDAMSQEWRRAARSGQSMAVLMMDVDHFKHYNDTLGHVQGDGCLRAIADIIGKQARRPGDLAVRYGGEEFLLLFPATDREMACRHAEKLIQAIRHAEIPQAPGLAREHVSISIGVAVTIPGIGMVNSEELVCAADDALYEAKNAGRDGWRFAAGIDPVGSHHDAIPNQKGTV